MYRLTFHKDDTTYDVRDLSELYDPLYNKLDLYFQDHANTSNFIYEVLGFMVNTSTPGLTLSAFTLRKESDYHFTLTYLS